MEINLTIPIAQYKSPHHFCTYSLTILKEVIAVFALLGFFLQSSSVLVLDINFSSRSLSLFQYVSGRPLLSERRQ